MNNAARRLISFLIGIAAGFGGLLAGVFLGAAVGRFITGEQGLHGFDVITLFCMGSGAVVGLLVGTRAGSIVAAKLLRRVSDENRLESDANEKGRKHDT